MRQTLKDRVAIVTGSSRGLGRAFSLALSRAGARVVVTGTTEVDSKALPGTIHSTAQEIRAQGGDALALRVDVRRPQDVEGMVAEAIAHFGRLDILVNNAGAMWWKPVRETPPKRVTMLYEINLRASYLASYHALPHMIAGGFGHIVMNSPPILTIPTPDFGMYYCTKMGMTRLALAIAAEHAEDNVAANSLWPLAPIDTSAVRNGPPEHVGTPDQWRTSDIMCDALLELVASDPRSCTGQQLLDEEFLRGRGWTDEDIGAYWLAGTPPERPLWLDRRWHIGGVR